MNDIFFKNDQSISTPRKEFSERKRVFRREKVSEHHTDGLSSA